MPARLKLALWMALVGLAAALLGFGTARFLSVPLVTPQPGTTDFALPDLAGKTHSLGDWRGKLVLLNFWATWCPPCREEIPLFIDLQRRHAKRGLQIVGISVDNPEAVARYWQEQGINYPLLLADSTTYGLMAAYGNRNGGLPFSVVITPDGRIAAQKIGAFQRQELESMLKPYLSQSRPASP